MEKLGLDRTEVLASLKAGTRDALRMAYCLSWQLITSTIEEEVAMEKAAANGYRTAEAAAAETAEALRTTSSIK